MQNMSLANHNQSQMYFTDLILYNQIVSSFSCSVRTKIAKFKITCTILPVVRAKIAKLKKARMNPHVRTDENGKTEKPPVQFCLSVRVKMENWKTTRIIPSALREKSQNLKNNRTLRSNSTDKIGSIEIALAFVDNVHEVIPQLFQ